MENFYKNKKIFITGNTGFKGSYLSAILISMGAIVKGYSNNIPTNPSMFKLMNLEDKMTNVYGDIRDREKIYQEISNFQPDILIHLAAQPIVSVSLENPIYTYSVNTIGTINVLECIRNTPSIKSSVIITTDKVYKNTESNIHIETDELGGIDPYSASKSCADLATQCYYRSYFKNNPNTAISVARAANVIGGGDFSPNRIVPDMIRAYLNKEDIIIRNKTAVRPFQHVYETLTGYLLLAMMQYKNKSIEGVYNFGPNNTQEFTIEKLVNGFCDALDNKVKWVEQKEINKMPETNVLRLDSQKALNVLNWKNILTFDELIGYITNWIHLYECNENMYNSIIKEYARYREKLK